jgi:hypothetical protein
VIETPRFKGGTQRDGSKAKEAPKGTGRRQKKVKRFACPLCKGTGRLFGSFFAIAGPLVGMWRQATFWGPVPGPVPKFGPGPVPINSGPVPGPVPINLAGFHGTETCPLVPMFGHGPKGQVSYRVAPLQQSRGLGRECEMHIRPIPGLFRPWSTIRPVPGLRFRANSTCPRFRALLGSSAPRLLARGLALTADAAPSPIFTFGDSRE